LWIFADRYLIQDLQNDPLTVVQGAYSRFDRASEALFVELITFIYDNTFISSTPNALQAAVTDELAHLMMAKGYDQIAFHDIISRYPSLASSSCFKMSTIARSPTTSLERFKRRYTTR